MKNKILPVLVVGLMITMTSLPMLGSSSKNLDVTLDACYTTDYINDWQDTGLRIKEWPIDGEVYAYVEVSSDDLFEVTITHRWWYDNGTGLENKWEWD